GSGRVPNLDDLAISWYRKFFKLLRERVPTERLPALFSNISIINFNYDRSLEHYLAHLIVGFYNVTYGGAVELVKTLTHVHPYGTIGPWHDQDGHHEFGKSLDDADLLLQLSDRIQTFTDTSTHAG